MDNCGFPLCDNGFRRGPTLWVAPGCRCPRVGDKSARRPFRVDNWALVRKMSPGLFFRTGRGQPAAAEIRGPQRFWPAPGRAHPPKSSGRRGGGRQAACRRPALAACQNRGSFSCRPFRCAESVRQPSWIPAQGPRHRGVGRGARAALGCRPCPRFAAHARPAAATTPRPDRRKNLPADRFRCPGRMFLLLLESFYKTIGIVVRTGPFCGQAAFIQWLRGLGCGRTLWREPG